MTLGMADPTCYPNTDGTIPSWKTAKKYQKFKTEFVKAIRTRSVAEFSEAHKASISIIPESKRVTWLQRACRKAAKAIVRCITGEHEMCASGSRVCKAHEDSEWGSPHLPNHAPIKMTKQDKQLLFDALLTGKFDSELVEKQKKNAHTNVTETRHNSSLKANVKGISNKKFHVAKAVSDQLKHSVGYGSDAIRIAQMTGNIVTRSMMIRSRRKLAEHDKVSSERARMQRRRNKARRTRSAKPVTRSSTDIYQGKTADFVRTGTN